MSTFVPPQISHASRKLKQTFGDQGDRRDGKVYVFDDKIPLRMAVRVALATGRPLLLSGPSGCGKSSLALHVALVLGSRYYEFVTTSKSEARDLLYRYDAVGRLNDGHAGLRKEQQAYVWPGALWWAIAPELAKTRGKAGVKDVSVIEEDPNLVEGAGEHAVVLIDEIDKADPEFPNALLVPLGSYRFEVEPTEYRVTLAEKKAAPLVIITTNQERDLPATFVRRCIYLDLAAPTKERLEDIAKQTIAEALKAENAGLVSKLAEYAVKERSGNYPRGGAPGTAEYLDLVRACLTQNIGPEHDDFEKLSAMTFRKPGAR